MFKRKPVEKTELEKLIDETVAHLRTLDATANADEFDEVTKKLGKLTKLRKTEPRPQRVSPDTLAIIAGNVAITTVVVFHERMNNIGTKALHFLTPNKLR